MTPVTGPRPPSDTDPDPGADRQARAYETRKNQLFLAQIILTGVLLACYLFSGTSAHLAEGLRSLTTGRVSVSLTVLLAAAAAVMTWLALGWT